jgi:hypothetical protein
MLVTETVQTYTRNVWPSFTLHSFSFEIGCLPSNQNEERDYQSGFTTLLSALPQEQPVVVLCLKIILVFWLLARDGHGEYNGLRGSGRRSITPYVNRRRELYCSSICPCVPEYEDFIAR